MQRSQVIDAGDSESDGNKVKVGKSGWISGIFLDMDQKEFADELDVREGRRGVKDNTKLLAWGREERILLTERWDKIIEALEENIIFNINIIIYNNISITLDWKCFGFKEGTHETQSYKEKIARFNYCKMQKVFIVKTVF